MFSIFYAKLVQIIIWNTGQNFLENVLQPRMQICQRKPSLSIDTEYPNINSLYATYNID